MRWKVWERVVEKEYRADVLIVSWERNVVFLVMVFS